MISKDKVDEWIQEVSESPSSAPLIIQYISNRLRDLTRRNEELLAENISLRTGHKVEEYESRIANLAYQLELLKRQMGGESFTLVQQVISKTLSIILYLPEGHVLRYEVDRALLTHGALLTRVPAGCKESGEHARLLITNPMEELLFVLDSGRTISMAVEKLPVAELNADSWDGSTQIETRGGEELSAVLPIGKMTLFEYCIQSSRRGCAKKMMKNSFESHVSKGFIGTGIKQKPDRTCALTLCGRDDIFVMVSQEGFLLGTDVSGLPYNAEELVKLINTDHIVSSFIIDSKPSLVTVTQNGKAVIREAAWIEKSASGKSRGQALFSQSRRDAGVRVVGAAAVDANDWGAALLKDGRVLACSMAEVVASGDFSGLLSGAEIEEFVAFSIQTPDKG